MPIKPKSVQRPWIKSINYNSMPGQGRKVVSMFYHSKGWKKLRNAFIKSVSTHLGTVTPHNNAICIHCARRGVTTPTHTIDHMKRINPLDPYDTMNGLYGEPLQRTNLQPLCMTCNAQKTARETKTK